MGVRTICEHGYVERQCRCMNKYEVTVVPCTRPGGRHRDTEVKVQPNQVLNPEILSSGGSG